MLKDGKYAAWFRTSRGEGTGIVHLANGKISGGDSIFTYGGSYEIHDNRFTATLTTKRHAAGPSTVFGIDEVEVEAPLIDAEFLFRQPEPAQGKAHGHLQRHDGFMLG